MGHDFLSSLEVVALHRADVLYMQNWDHVSFVLDRCNLLPERDNGTDFARTRPYFLEEKGKERRQLIVASAFNEPKVQKQKNDSRDNF